MSAAFARVDETVDMAAEVERAKLFGAQQAALGLDRTMVSSMALPARIARPAVGAGFDAGRLDRAIENVGTDAGNAGKGAVQRGKPCAKPPTAARR